METEARCTTLTENDLVNILRYVAVPNKADSLGRFSYGLGDKIGAYLANLLSSDGKKYRYAGFLHPSQPYFQTVAGDPDYLLITNFAVDANGYFQEGRSTILRKIASLP